ncbi:MAG: TRAP transporter large permease subunit [Oscillospiraceae bacterium]
MSSQIVNAIVAMNLAPWLFCLVVAIILLIFGTFLEGISICVLLVPVLWPIAQSLGVNAIHFGMIVCVGIVIGNMTPPVAVNLFASASVSKLSISEIAKGEIPVLPRLRGRVLPLCSCSGDEHSAAVNADSYN